MLEQRFGVQGIRAESMGSECRSKKGGGDEGGEEEEEEE